MRNEMAGKLVMKCQKKKKTVFLVSMREDGVHHMGTILDGKSVALAGEEWKTIPKHVKAAIYLFDRARTPAHLKEIPSPCPRKLKMFCQFR